MRLPVLMIALTLLPALATAQNREHLQLTADLRMVQEQVSRLQLTVNQLAEQVKATDARVDAQASANVKAFADQQLLVNQISANLNTVREKLDDNTVRVSQLTQEMSAIRDGVRMLADQINTLVGLLQPPSAAAVTPDGAAPAGAGASRPPAEGDDAPAASAAAPPVNAVNLPASPGRIFQQAYGDYMSGRYDNAIEGFREVIAKYPTAPDAANAQFSIADSYYQQGKCREAIVEYQKLVTNYKTSEHMAEAYNMQGVCYQDLGQRANAQKMFELVVREYPGTTSALLAKQRLQK
jgi:tol-pal system protein YbgF